MAFLYVTEYQALASVPNNTDVAIAYFPPIAEQVVAIAAGSTPSAPFNKLTRFIEVTSDVVCSIAVNHANSAAPVAAITNYRLAAGVSKIIKVDGPEYNFQPKNGLPAPAQIAVIANT